MKKLAIKADGDTLRGYTEGVPRLLALFYSLGIRCSFLLSFGPDNSGKTVRHMLRPSFISKALSTNAVSIYGVKSLMYGTLKFAPINSRPAPLNRYGPRWRAYRKPRCPTDS